MNSAGAATFVEGLPESRRAALLNLLTDEDPAVYWTVREKILSLGPEASRWLQSHTLSNDPALRRRAQEIIFYFERQKADNQFLGFCLRNGEEFDLEQASWMLAQTRYPGINIEGYRALMDHFARELTARIDPGDEPRQVLRAINDYLFKELGFQGNEENYYDPENSYLNRVIDRRKGNPINLCLLYVLLARRLRLPLTGIGLPGHFICRYQSTGAEIYIDPFHAGKLLTKGDCVQYLVHGSFSLKEDYLTPVSPRRMLLRICGNLHQIYLQLEAADEITRLQRYLVALAR